MLLPLPPPRQVVYEPLENALLEKGLVPGGDPFTVEGCPCGTIYEARHIPYGQQGAENTFPLHSLQGEAPLARSLPLTPLLMP